MTSILRTALAGLLLVLPLDAQLGAARAEYEVTFEATWSAGTHPGAYPAGAHFSPLIGSTHVPTAHLWRPGGIASAGMEEMAELGGTFLLSQQIDDAIALGIAGERLNGSGISSPGSTSIVFEVTDEHPVVSLVTMVAPSPDWFVGVDALPLVGPDGWLEEVVVELPAWDAGTDSGVAFTSPNQDTQPQEPIALITGGPFTGTDPLGTFSFRRRAATLEFGTCANPAGSLTASDLPRIGGTLDLAVHDPGGTMPVPSQVWVAFALAPDPAFPCGLSHKNWGLAAPGTPGDVLFSGPVQTMALPPWNGAPSVTSVSIPPDMALIDMEVVVQGVLLAPGTRVGVTSGLLTHVGP